MKCEEEFAIVTVTDIHILGYFYWNWDTFTGILELGYFNWDVRLESTLLACNNWAPAVRVLCSYVGWCDAGYDWGKARLQPCTA